MLSNISKLLEIKIICKVDPTKSLFLPTPGEAKAKAMPGRLYTHTKINNNNKNHFCVLFEFSQKGMSQGHENLCVDSSRPN